MNRTRGRWRGTGGWLATLLWRFSSIWAKFITLSLSQESQDWQNMADETPVALVPMQLHWNVWVRYQYSSELCFRIYWLLCSRIILEFNSDEYWYLQSIIDCCVSQNGLLCFTEWIVVFQSWLFVFHYVPELIVCVSLCSRIDCCVSLCSRIDCCVSELSVVFQNWLLCFTIDCCVSQLSVHVVFHNWLLCFIMFQNWLLCFRIECCFSELIVVFHNWLLCFTIECTCCVS